MRSVLVHKTHLLTDELDMISHVEINQLQKITCIHASNTEYCNLIYNSGEGRTTLEFMISNSNLGTSALVSLLEQIYALEDAIDGYLLSAKRICYNPAYVYYEPKTQHYLWQYLPDNSFDGAYSQLQLVRHLLVEIFSNDNQLWFDVIKLLSLKTYNLQNLIIFIKQSISGKPILNESKHIKFSLKKPFSKKVIPQNPYNTKHNIPDHNKKTTHIEHYAVLINKNDSTQQFPLYFDVNMIGRDESNNICLKDSTISSMHAQIERHTQYYYLKDCDSSNGTHVNNNLIQGSHTLVNGDIIQIGKKEFIFIR